MQKTKNHYIKYTKAELENYTTQPESCVKKIKCIEPIRFSPTIIANFQTSILRILSKKIGKYDVKLDGVVLDFRNTKIYDTTSGIRQDSAFSAVNVETNFYVFSPKRGDIVTGTVKYINRMNMETIISVVVYRVFNVKVTVKGRIKYEIEKNQEIQVRVKDYHFENVIPFIEGEVVNLELTNRKLFEDVADSGISEGSTTSEAQRGLDSSFDMKIKQERASSVESSSSPPTPRKGSNKRKLSDMTSSTTQVKKIKLEPNPPSEDDFPSTSDVKDCKDVLSESQIERELSTSTQSANGNKNKSKKKRKRGSDSDDFETALQKLLLDTQIKKEKR